MSRAIGNFTDNEDNMKRKVEVKHILVAPDIHIPWEDEKTLWAFEKYMASRKWDEVIQLGDLLDLGCISHWNDGKAKTMAEQSQFEDDLGMGELLLDRWLKILRAKNPDAKFTYIEGNHEYWAKMAVEKSPSLEKTLDRKSVV